jgi:hypothetical protein
MNRSIRLFTTLLVIAFALSVAQAQEKKITRKQLPPAVEQTVVRESQGATIKGFAVETEHGQKFYEASLNVNGHNKDVLIDKDGNVVEVEEEVTMDSLPATVQEAIKKAAGTGTIGVIESLSRNGQIVAYEAHVKHGRKRSEIKVGPNGEPLKAEQ